MNIGERYDLRLLFLRCYLVVDGTKFVFSGIFLSRGVYGHFEISPRDSCIIAQLAFASFYRSQSREMGTMLEEYLESVTN